MDEGQKDNDSNYLNSFLILAAVLVLISIVFPFIVNSIFSDWSKSGTFGDTFGALNALYSGLALAGVIVTILIQKRELENQRVELQLQRSEMQETRKEFLINRTTNLIYSQLDRFEKAISELTITYDGKVYVGNDAISFLDKNKELLFIPNDQTDEQFREAMKRSVIKLLRIYSPNKSEIEKFARNAYNSVEVLKRLVYKTDLEIDELHDLKSLFFVNIGFNVMNIIERLSDVTHDELTYLEAEDYPEDLDVGTMSRANIFLKPIKEFQHQRLKKENFESLKKAWEKSKGDNV